MAFHAILSVGMRIEIKMKLRKNDFGNIKLLRTKYLISDTEFLDETVQK